MDDRQCIERDPAGKHHALENDEIPGANHVCDGISNPGTCTQGFLLDRIDVADMMLVTHQVLPVLVSVRQMVLLSGRV